MIPNPQKRESGKIVVAMSGGVDSSVAAAMLKQEGFDVRGVFMAAAQPNLSAQIAVVKRIAALLDIPLEIVDLAEDFEREILDYFTKSYLEGKTPNPCVVCNREIKFGRLMESACNGEEVMMATGHYARVIHDRKGCFRLFKGRDPVKEQSYFLSLLTKEQLSRICFPLGEYTKEEVLRLSGEYGLPDFPAGESQDVCFLTDQDVRGFLARRIGKIFSGGSIVTISGRELGRHDGICGFTVGQRRGLAIPDATPYYVVRLDPDGNKVVVGKKEDLWQDHFLVRDVNWISGSPPAMPLSCDVKIRYRAQAGQAVVDHGPDNMFQVEFSECQRAVTPGQFAVFYNQDEVIGGGEIVIG
ncbi:MAG: tRNA 2-thiouridine(34) synthase MnmA [Desulfobulbaceae bacterium]|nr:tRNA 2-thiouridine(34) synthase MnmA [Desulfobulbaceae bacterium]